MEQKVDELGAKTGTENAYALRAEMTVTMKEHFGLFRDEPTMKAGVEKLLFHQGAGQEHQPSLDGELSSTST